MENLGNYLYRIVDGARFTLFDQGELAQLTYGAFDIAAKSLAESDQEQIQISFPVGYRADKTTIESTRTYKKNEILSRYQYLAFNQLSTNGIIQLVTIVEAAVSDIIRAVILKYPKKLSGKRTIAIKSVLESSSIQEVHMRATDGFINELTYKSPADFAEAIRPILSINLLECPAFHKYIEVKATRDIYIHNRGAANDVYVRKAGTHARVKDGMNLPTDVQYFLESYESCIQVIEWLEQELHQHWHSSELEEKEKGQSESNQQAPSKGE
jgi:hypothetical protein